MASATYELLSGLSYDVDELDPGAAWAEGTLDCGAFGTGAGGAAARITVAPGDVVECSIPNSALGNITVIKDTVGADGTFGFTLNGDPFGITTLAGTGNEDFSEPPARRLHHRRDRPDGELRRHRPLVHQLERRHRDRRRRYAHGHGRPVERRDRGLHLHQHGTCPHRGRQGHEPERRPAGLHLHRGLDPGGRWLVPARRRRRSCRQRPHPEQRGVHGARGAAARLGRHRLRVRRWQQRRDLRRRRLRRRRRIGHDHAGTRRDDHLHRHQQPAWPGHDHQGRQPRLGQPCRRDLHGGVRPDGRDRVVHRRAVHAHRHARLRPRREHHRCHVHRRLRRRSAPAARRHDRPGRSARLHGCVRVHHRRRCEPGTA